MIQLVEILGAHAWFFRDGDAYTVPGAGTASRTAKPGAADPKWLDFGVVDVTAAPKMETKEIWRPAPAVKELEDIVAFKRQLDFKIKKQELSALDFELIFQTLSLDYISGEAGGQFNPLERQGDVVRGWLKLEYFGRQSGRAGNNPLLTSDTFVALSYDGDFAPGDGPIEPAFIARVLRSTLNTGTLA